MLGFGKKKSKEKKSAAQKPALREPAHADDDVEEEIIYVDEAGNPIDDEEDVEYVYVDEDGNPIELAGDEEVVYVDEDGNVVDPDTLTQTVGCDAEEDIEVIYVDENGNRVDENGDPLPIEKKLRPMSFADTSDDASAEYVSAREAIQANFQKHIRALERAHDAGAVSSATFAAQIKEQGRICEARLAELDSHYEFVEEEVPEKKEKPAEKSPVAQTLDDVKVVVKEGTATLREMKTTVAEFKELTDFKNWLK